MEKGDSGVVTSRTQKKKQLGSSIKGVANSRSTASHDGKGGSCVKWPPGGVGGKRVAGSADRTARGTAHHKKQLGVIKGSRPRVPKTAEKATNNQGAIKYRSVPGSTTVEKRKCKNLKVKCLWLPTKGREKEKNHSSGRKVSVNEEVQDEEK